jgi:hypothetical protein
VARVAPDALGGGALLQDEVAQSLPDGFEPGGQPGRPGSDDHDVVRPGGCGCRCGSGRSAALRPPARGDRLDGDPTFVDGVLDETPAAELADDEHARHAGLEVQRDLRDLDALHGGVRRDDNRADRAGLLALTVGGALRSVDLRQLADEGHGAGLGARRDARSAPDAHVGAQMACGR